LQCPMRRPCGMCVRARAAESAGGIWIGLLTCASVHACVCARRGGSCSAYETECTSAQGILTVAVGWGQRRRGAAPVCCASYAVQSQHTHTPILAHPRPVACMSAHLHGPLLSSALTLYMSASTAGQPATPTTTAHPSPPSCTHTRARTWAP